MQRAEEEITHERFDLVHSMVPITCCDVYQPRGGTVAESVERNLALIRSNWFRRAKRMANRFNAKQRSLLRREACLFNRRSGPLVAALSRYVVDQLKRHYRIDPARVRLVFNGVDVPDAPEDRRVKDRHDLRARYGLGSQELVLLSVAHNFKLKGVGRCIEAMERLARRGGPVTKVLIVGRDDPAPYRRLAERLRIADRVIFTGPTEQVTAFYHAADILVHPTYYDPCSRVVLEALASGLPAITTRHNGAAEVIEDGVHGYVIDSADAVDQLADRIARLADDDHRLACGRYSRLLRDQLSMARHADEMLAVYQEVLQQRGTP